MSLVEPLEEMFPVLKALLDRDGLWDTCVQAFLEARALRSGHYRDIAPSFLGWLASSHWGQERWPFLLELAHAEILEVLVARFPDSDPPGGLHADPGPHDAIVLDPATQVVTYGHAVHRTRETAPVPEAVETHLLAYRDHQGRAQLLELTPGTAAFLVRAQSEPLAQAAQALHLDGLTPALNLLRDLHREGAIAGFQSAT